MEEKHLELNHHEEGDSKSPPLQSVQEIPKERLLQMYRSARSRLEPVVDQFLDHIERKRPNNYATVKESLKALDNAVDTDLKNQKTDIQFQEELEKICSRLTKELTNFRKNNLVAKPYWDPLFNAINMIRDECRKTLDAEFHLPSFNESQELQKQNGYGEFHRNVILRWIHSYIEILIAKLRKSFHCSDLKNSAERVYMLRDVFTELLNQYDNLIRSMQDCIEDHIDDEIMKDTSALIKFVNANKFRSSLIDDLIALIENKMPLKNADDRAHFFSVPLSMESIVRALKSNIREKVKKEVSEWSLRETMKRILFPQEEIVIGHREKGIIRDYILDLSQDPDELEQFFSDDESCSEIITRINTDLYGGNPIVDFEMIHPAIISVIRDFNLQRNEAETVQMERPRLDTPKPNIAPTQALNPIDIKEGEFSISITPNKMQTNGIDFPRNPAGAVDEGPDDITLYDEDSDVVHKPENQAGTTVNETKPADLIPRKEFSTFSPGEEYVAPLYVPDGFGKAKALSEKADSRYSICQKVEEVLSALDTTEADDGTLEIRLEQFALELDSGKREYDLATVWADDIKRKYDQCLLELSKLSIGESGKLLNEIANLNTAYANASDRLLIIDKNIEELEGAIGLIRDGQELNLKRSVIKDNLIRKIEEVLQGALDEAGIGSYDNFFE